MDTHLLFLKLLYHRITEKSNIMLILFIDFDDIVHSIRDI